VVDTGSACRIYNVLLAEGRRVAAALIPLVMPLELYLAFIAATVVLMVIPGPNVALIVANSVAHGTRFGLLTVAATSSAVVCISR
jgi:hypothetical protein